MTLGACTIVNSENLLCSLILRAVFRARKEQDIPRIQEAELRNDKIKNELQDLKKEQTALTNEVTKLSEIRKGLKDQIVSEAS